MNGFVYNDEDNAPMNEASYSDLMSLGKDGHNPTIYTSISEMKADERGEALPFTDPPEDGCWNCLNYGCKHEACTLNWNNNDESYYNPDTDDREPTDYCEDHERDPDAVWEDWFGDD